LAQIHVPFGPSDVGAADERFRNLDAFAIEDRAADAHRPSARFLVVARLVLSSTAAA
jgi:hypothetical protein